MFFVTKMPCPIVLCGRSSLSCESDEEETPLNLPSETCCNPFLSIVKDSALHLQEKYAGIYFPCSDTVL
jgi:hypothetical protein